MTDEFLDDLEWLIISLFKILYYGFTVYGSFIVAGWWARLMPPLTPRGG